MYVYVVKETAERYLCTLRSFDTLAEAEQGSRVWDGQPKSYAKNEWSGHEVGEKGLLNSATGQRVPAKIYELTKGA